tara:strand:+ start:665 stop:994 length:330 start_codon:yes stop_codon:yes gene_type:complete
MVSIGFHETEDGVYADFKVIMARERTAINQWFTEQMKKYIKEHGDGNPIYTIDKFVDPNFKPCPAFYSSNETLINYLKKLSTKAHKEYDQQLQNQLTSTTIAWKYPKHD